MDQKALDFIFSTRQLTDYREDWPGGVKGCLFYVSEQGYPCSVILDTPWRKGTTWINNYPLLPVELEMVNEIVLNPCLEVNKDKYKERKVVCGYPALLISYLFSDAIVMTMEEFRTASKEIWDYYMSKDEDDNDFNLEVRFISILGVSHFGDDPKIKAIEKLIPAGELLNFQTLPNLIYSTTCAMIEPRVEEKFNMLTPQNLINFEDFHLTLPDHPDFEIDIPVEYDDLNDNQIFPEGAPKSEKYLVKGDAVYLQYYADSKVLVKTYKAPDCYERVLEDPNDWHDNYSEYIYPYEQDGDLLAIEFVACLISYCACLKMRQNSQFGWSINPDSFGETWMISLKNVKISCNIIEFYELYFEDYLKRYTDDHLDDPDFCLMTEDDRKLTAIQNSIAVEEDYKEINKDILPYLSAEQLSQIDKYEAGFLTFLKNKIKELKPKKVIYSSQTNMLPPENNYQAVIEWLDRQKEQGHDYLAEARGNRSRMCRDISPILGWTVDDNSLGHAIKRQ